MKRPNPDTVSPGAFNGASARAAGPARPRPAAVATGARRQDAPRPARRSGPGAGPRGLPGSPRLDSDGRLDVKIKIRPEHAGMLQMNDWPAELQDGESAEPALALPSPPVLATPCRPATAMPCQLAPATPGRPAMSVPCRPALATPCRPAMAVPSQLPAVPGRKPPPGPLLQRRPPRPLPPPGSLPPPGPLLQRRPPRPLPPPGSLPPLSRLGPLPRPRPAARPGLRSGP